MKVTLAVARYPRSMPLHRTAASEHARRFTTDQIESICRSDLQWAINYARKHWGDAATEHAGSALFYAARTYRVGKVPWSAWRPISIRNHIRQKITTPRQPVEINLHTISTTDPAHNMHTWIEATKSVVAKGNHFQQKLRWVFFLTTIGQLPVDVIAQIIQIPPASVQSIINDLRQSIPHD